MHFYVYVTSLTLFVLQILLNILGLKKVEDTYIGNEFIRGVSGGQKKRVTIGIDMLKGANIYIMVYSQVRICLFFV